MTQTVDSKSSTLVKAAIVTMVVTVSGSALGFVRDLLLARYFGAGSDTDAFLVSWTVPETAFPLVVEGAMSFLLVPLFSRAVAGNLSAREAVAATLPRITAVLVVVSTVVALAAPVIVRFLAPGLAEPELAVTCTRLTSVTVLMFGLAGYVSAALRAHHVFAAPAAIHLAYNVGILGLMWTLHGRIGIVSAAAGVALGSVFMVLVQLPSFVRHVGFSLRRTSGPALVTLGAFVPLAAYTLTRQAQVFVERFLGSNLEPGTISYLNYAQKMAQLPMLVALLVCTVTFPTLARNVAAGEDAAARRRLESDLRTVTAMILVAASYLVVFAPAIVEVLLEHGEFSNADTNATAAILRVYALGLLGHALVGVLSRPFFTGERPTWHPFGAMAAGLTLTAVVAFAGAPRLGAWTIAAANGAGITLTAALLLVGLRHRILAVSLPAVASATARLGAAAIVAGALGWVLGRLLLDMHPLLTLVGGGAVVLVAFTGLAHLFGIGEVARLASRVAGRFRRV